MSDLLDRVISGTQPKSRATHAEQRVAAGRESLVSDLCMAARRKASGGVTVEQSISGSELKENRQTVNVETRDPVYYFELQVLERRTIDDSTEVFPVEGPLREGKTYLVRVTLNENQYSGTPAEQVEDYRQEQKRISGEVSVYLEFERDEMASGISILNQDGRLSPREPAAIHDFELVVKRVHAPSVTLILLFKLSSTAHAPQSASWLTLKLQGVVALLPARIAQILHLAADAEPPDGAAILHVSHLDENRLRLVGWAGKRVNSSLNLDSQSFTLPDSKDYPTGEAYIKEISNRAHAFTINEAGAVADWFDKVLNLYGENSCVIIIDQSGSQIPWELFKLRGGHFLGARALVVRWTEAQYRDQPIVMPGGDLKFEGRVCSFIHPIDAELMANNSPGFKNLISNYNTTPEELERELYCSTEQEPVGLVYLCYGGMLFYGDEGQMIEDLGCCAPYKETVQIRLELAEGRLKPRPVFFANAPYTGRLLVSQKHIYGLAKAFLTQMAASYIGLLAPIDRHYAGQFAQEFLTAALSEEGVKPAELLRKARAEAVARLADRRLSSEEWARARLEFIYPFMYVYYGNPQDLLKLTAPNQSGTSEEKGKEHV
jgi:hypothetical protein